VRTDCAALRRTSSLVSSLVKADFVAIVEALSSGAFFGAGVHFLDDDLKYMFSSLGSLIK
jgi:hypothetical protein